MSASILEVSVLAPVAFDELDQRQIGTRVLVGHRLGTCQRTSDMVLPKGHRRLRCKHLAVVSDVAPVTPASKSKVLYLGGEWVLVTADDVVVAAHPITAPDIDVEADVAGDGQ